MPSGSLMICVVGKMSKAVLYPLVIICTVEFMYLKESSDIDLRRQNEYDGAVGLNDSPLYRR